MRKLHNGVHDVGYAWCYSDGLGAQCKPDFYVRLKCCDGGRGIHSDRSHSNSRQVYAFTYCSMLTGRMAFSI
uniref:Uncharacterized protein n=1 Tax=Onchocerca volvulus TaxID=6282 RepID=A0A8R1XSY7_ONCVO